MNSVPQTFFRAASIAKATNSHRRAVHRRALAEGWPRRMRGNRVEYCPPKKLTRLIPDRPKDARWGPLSAPAMARALTREQAVRFMNNLVDSGYSQAAAIRMTTKAFSSPFKISDASLRHWHKSYAQGGFIGLFERKLGRVGRKRKDQ